MDDNKIVEMYFVRDEKALSETAEKYGKLCHKIAYNILGNNEDSEECVNDAYVGVWNSIPPARPTSFMAFLCKITRNLSLGRLEYLTREKRSRTSVISLSELEDILPDEAISSGISDGEISRAISEFLKGENETSRNVFIRKYYFFDSVKDIAGRYSFSESKVKSMLFHARTRLKEYLTKEGIKI